VTSVRETSGHTEGRSGRSGRLSRRGFLVGSGTAAAGVAVATVAAPPRPAAARPPYPTGDSPVPAAEVLPGDPRYPALVTGFNQRFTGTPAAVVVVTTQDQCVAAVRAAVAAGRRVTVRAGGHCYEGFVTDNPGGVVLDVSGMRAVTRTPDGGIRLESGCTNWDVYELLYKSHGVTLPAGSCYSVGLGGHVVGGGYGLMSREHGLTVDHLSALDVVVVDADRSVRVVTARRGDPLTGDLFWAHTGGGGGTFGVVVAYTFRDLPAPPPTVQLATTTWQWSALDAASFATLLRNYGGWLAANSGPDSPGRRLFGLLKLSHVSAGTVTLLTQASGEDPALLDSFLGALDDGMPAAALPTTTRRTMPWLQATQTLNGSGPNQRGKYKSAYMRRPFPDRHVAALHAALTDASYRNPQALVQVDTYGGRINAVASGDTAVSQRSSIMKLQYQTYWTDPAEDELHLGWIRRCYASVYADTGGEPARDDVTDGCYVNYPDVDLRDWPTLYFGPNYRRLQEVKGRWDPTDQFHHAQSVRPPGR
jgi:FAD/FMN-containing dehydrogenase